MTAPSSFSSSFLDQFRNLILGSDSTSQTVSSSTPTVSSSTPSSTSTSAPKIEDKSGKKKDLDSPLDPSLPEIEWGTEEYGDIESVIGNKEAARELRGLNKAKNFNDIWTTVRFNSIGCDPETKKTIMHTAIESGEILLVKLVALFQPEFINKKAQAGMSPIIFAALAGDEKMIEFLVNPGVFTKGVKANLDDTADEINSNMSALHFAVMYGHVKAAYKLVELGASKETLTNKGLTAADCANFKLHSYDKDTGVSVADDPIQAAKFSKFVKDFAPKRGVLKIQEIIKLLNYVEATEKKSADKK